MNERTTLEIIAPTVEEALAQGLAQLGMPADAVSVEVLDAGNKGLFGLGGRQVRVRLTVNPPGESPVAEPPTALSKKNKRPESRAALPQESGKPGAAEVSAPKEKKVESKSQISTEAEHDRLLDTTEAIISKILHHLGLQAQVSAHYDETQQERRTIQVDIRGDDLSALIGRHAETLNAFQYIASLIVGKEMEQWVQLVVDVEGYRSRRERQLRQLARRMAEQVTKSGRRAALEPMNSGERRIIHLELRGHPAVTTESIGEEPHRKVTIVPKES
jgi:spoIIIJ-associated protein